MTEILFYNPVLFAALMSWAIAQLLKVFIEFFTMRRWNWALVFESGGMPSSHSAMMSSTALATGLFFGFDSGLFALAAVVAMIVVYDAPGVRQESGKQAVLINSIIEELSKGHLPPQGKLKEMLGHTPGEAILGTTLGFLIALATWLLVS